MILFIGLSANAQDFPVKGHVSSSVDGQIIPGVNIVVDGTKKSTTTDFDGNFNINVSKNDVLTFTFLGFITQKVTVSDQTVFNISLKEELSRLQEVVIVGYGSQKKVNLTGSVSSIPSKLIDDRPITQASQALAGLASGVTVQQGSGRPGNDGATVRLRGIGTFSGAGNDPLVLIDWSR